MTQLDTCGCFPTRPEPPRRPDNPPGLDRIAYRAASHPASLSRMLADLPGPAADSELARLTTRERDDPAIALLDAAALVADVLSFYSERIANEGFLRTAIERVSVLELAREIGYELAPGLAATTYLAFGVEDRAVQPGQPAEALIPQGTRVQSVPAAGGFPQTFETSETFRARAAWNELRPVTTEPQDMDEAVETIYLAGTASGVRPGDVLLLAIPGPTGDIAGTPKPRLVHRVIPEGNLARTTVELAAAAKPAKTQPSVTHQPGKIGHQETNLTAQSADSAIGNAVWSEQSMSTFLLVNDWAPNDVVAYYGPKLATAPDLGPADPGVFAFHHRAAAFGHNAPNWNQLPDAVHTAYPKDWDASATKVNVTTSSQGGDLGSETVRLDTTYRVAPDSWVILTSGTPDQGKAYRIAQASDPSLADFAISAKVTQLALKTAAGAQPTDLKNFSVRGTSIQLGSERLELAPVPLPPTVEAGTTILDLDRLVLGLAVDQPVAVSGDRDDLAGIRGTEIVTLAAIEHSGGRTRLTFSPLEHPYRRATITLNANVVRASHGESVAREIMGSGTGRPDQRFRLRRPPVTQLTAATGTGTRSTLQVRVDGVRWDQAESFVDAGPRDEWYLLRRADNGTPTVIFGDGVNGAPPPTGGENVTADYRTGIGQPGMVGAGALTLFATRPPGVKDVTNPLPAQGAQDPQSRDDARVNAPLTLATLGRVVSMSDYEDFARAFAGIGKALSTELWRGQRRVVHVTVAGPLGAAIPNDTLSNLIHALENVRDPGITVEIEAYMRIFIRVTVDVLIDPRLEAAPTVERVRAALAQAFDFGRRSFGQAVSGSQIIATVLQVPGIVDTRILALHQVSEGVGEPAEPIVDPILSRLARWVGELGEIAAAELVLLEPAGATVTVRAT